MTQGKHFAAGGDHFAALPSKKIHTPKGIARLTVTAATMAAMTGSSLISPFTAFAQTGDGGTQHPAVMSPIAAHAGAASGTGAKSAAQTIADLQKAVDEAKAKEDAAKASYDEAAGPYNEAASARDQAKASYDSAVSAGTAADRAAMDEYARQVAEGKDAADAAGKENELIFGMLTPEVNNLKQVGYHPNAFITGDDVANYTLNFLERGWNGENFHEVTENLRTSDPYMVMADFKDYRRAQADLQKLYGDREKWAQMSLKNTANSGIFSADRAVLDYARDIWHASTVPMGK